MKSDETASSRIMVVDDQQDITITYKHILQNTGFIVDVFNNPFEALETFRERPEEYYDILLIDMKMPGMSGIELYQNISNCDKKIPKICFTTGYESLYNLLKQTFPEMNNKCFIRKPVDEDELVTTLKQELQKI